MDDRSPTQQARAYYRAIDDDDYDLLASLLDESFVHDRPDQRIAGSDRFVQFMRDERPQTDTTHPIDAVYQRVGDDHAPEVVVRGRLLDADGDLLARFLDVFQFEYGDIRRIDTYTQ